MHMARHNAKPTRLGLCRAGGFVLVGKAPNPSESQVPCELRPLWGAYVPIMSRNCNVSFLKIEIMWKACRGIRVPPNKRPLWEYKGDACLHTSPVLLAADF